MSCFHASLGTGLVVSPYPWIHSTQRTLCIMDKTVVPDDASSSTQTFLTIHIRACCTAVHMLPHIYICHIQAFTSHHVAPQAMHSVGNNDARLARILEWEHSHHDKCHACSSKHDLKACITWQMLCFMKRSRVKVLVRYFLGTDIVHQHDGGALMMHHHQAHSHPCARCSLSPLGRHTVGQWHVPHVMRASVQLVMCTIAQMVRSVEYTSYSSACFSNVWSRTNLSQNACLASWNTYSRWCENIISYGLMRASRIPCASINAPTCRQCRFHDDKCIFAHTCNSFLPFSSQMHDEAMHTHSHLDGSCVTLARVMCDSGPSGS